MILVKPVSDHVTPLLKICSTASCFSPSRSQSPSNGLKAILNLPYNTLYLSSSPTSLSTKFQKKGATGLLLPFLKYNKTTPIRAWVIMPPDYNTLSPDNCMVCSYTSFMFLPKCNLTEEALPDIPSPSSHTVSCFIFLHCSSHYVVYNIFMYCLYLSIGMWSPPWNGFFSV